jgi:hypothetical protein
MYQYSVLVAGNGETSRANVEALMEDHYHANSGNGVVVIAFDDRPSSGQIWAAQTASALGLDIVVYGVISNNFTAMPKSAIHQSKSPFKDAAEYVAANSESKEAFILWSDDDPASVEILAYCKDNDIPALDLRQGLMAIQPSETLVHEEKPEIPEEEHVPEVEIELELDEELEDEEESEYSYPDEVASAVLTIANYIADIVAEAVIARMKEGEE